MYASVRSCISVINISQQLSKDVFSCALQCACGEVLLRVVFKDDLIRCCSQVNLFKVYAIYCAHHSTAMAKLEEARKKDPALETFLQVSQNPTLARGKGESHLVMRERHERGVVGTPILQVLLDHSHFHDSYFSSSSFPIRWRNLYLDCISLTPFSHDVRVCVFINGAAVSRGCGRGCAASRAC